MASDEQERKCIFLEVTAKQGMKEEDWTVKRVS